MAILWLGRPVWEGVNALWCMFPLFPTALNHPVSPSLKASCPHLWPGDGGCSFKFCFSQSGSCFHLLCVWLTEHLLGGSLF